MSRDAFEELRRVWEAVTRRNEDGTPPGATARQVAAATGLPVGAVSIYLDELATRFLFRLEPTDDHSGMRAVPVPQRPAGPVRAACAVDGGGEAPIGSG